jgi:hypothetical protein
VPHPGPRVWLQATKNIKELLKIVTRHTSGEEAVRAAFALVEAVATASGVRQYMS